MRSADRPIGTKAAWLGRHAVPIECTHRSSDCVGPQGLTEREDHHALVGNNETQKFSRGLSCETATQWNTMELRVMW